MKTKMTRMLVFLVIISFAMSILAACSAPTTAPTTAAATTKAATAAATTTATTAATTTVAKKVTLTYGGGADATGATAEIVKKFMDANPNITVKIIELPADQGAQHDAYVTSFAAGGKDYDIFNSNVIWPAEFSQAGYVLPVETLIKRDNFPINDFQPGYVDAYTFKGRIWGIPAHSNAGLLFYRSDIVTTSPKTWDELYDMAGKYAGQGGTKFGYVFQAAQYEGLVCNAVEFFSAYGGKIVDGDGKVIINNQGIKDGLAKMVKFAQSSFVPKDVSTYKEAECTNSFAAGDAVFMRNWPGTSSTLEDATKSKVVGKSGIVALPAGPSGSFGAIGGWGIMINKNSANPEEAWLFTKFKCGAEGQKINALKASQPPLYMPLYKDAEIIAAKPFFKLLNDAVQTGTPRPVSPVYTELSSIMQIEISKALAGTQTVEAAVLKMDTAMKAVVK